MGENSPSLQGPQDENGGSKWTMLWRTSTGSNLTGLLVVECSKEFLKLVFNFNAVVERQF